MLMMLLGFLIIALLARELLGRDADQTLPRASAARLESEVERLRAELERLAAEVNRLEEEQSFLLRLLGTEERPSLRAGAAPRSTPPPSEVDEPPA